MLVVTANTRKILYFCHILDKYKHLFLHKHKLELSAVLNRIAKKDKLNVTLERMGNGISNKTTTIPYSVRLPSMGQLSIYNKYRGKFCQ